MKKLSCFIIEPFPNNLELNPNNKVVFIDIGIIIIMAQN